MITLIYLDACVIIDLVEGAPEMQRTLRNAIRNRNVVSTELARLESRIGALRRAQAEYLETYRLFFESCIMQPLDRVVFDLATDLRVRYGLKTPDAIHLAAAQVSACAELWTNDRRLAGATQGRLRIVTWAELDPASASGTPAP